VRPVGPGQLLLESRVQVSLETMQKFVSHLASITPRILTRGLQGEKVLIVSRSGAAQTGYALDLAAGTISEVAADQFGAYEVRIERKQHVLGGFLRILELWEAEFLPISKLFSWRGLRALLPRWREGVLYLHVVAHLIRGRSFLDIEKRLLGQRGAPAAR
jgi:hypothetical protein